MRFPFAAAVLVVLLTACDAPTPVGRPDATFPTPTWAPAPSASVPSVAVGAGVSSVAVAGGLVAVGASTGLHILDKTVITTPSPVRAVAAAPDGGFRAVVGASVLSVSASLTPAWWTLPSDGGAIAVHPSGVTAVALPATGDVIMLSPAGAVVRTVRVGGAVGAIAVDDTRLAVIDPTQTSLTVFDFASGARQESLRAGDGAVTVAADGTGRFVVVDARDGELLIFETGPLVLRQRYPVAGVPYGLSVDRTRRTAWVTVTQRNEVAGFDLTGGAPREVARHATARLPLPVAVDSSTGTVVVAGTDEGLVQRIAP